MQPNLLTIEEIKTKSLPVLKKAGVLRSSIFGSVARGEADKDSDVDFLVELPSRATLFDLAHLQIQLQETLKKKVDVVEFDTIKPALKNNILSNQIQLQ